LDCDGIKDKDCDYNWGCDWIMTGL
jgi:hypothetical protein